MSKRKPEKTKNCAVIFVYSEDPEVAVYLFENYEKAAEFLRDSYNEEIRIDREENGWEVNGHIEEDSSYARIGVVFNGDETVIEMYVGNIYQ